MFLKQFKTASKGIIRKNANHLQTTDTIKRHQRYSIRHHCGWPSLWTWGSATHYGLPAFPEPLLRACGLHRVCTASKKSKQQSHTCVPAVCTWFVQGTKKSKQQSNSPCCQLHLQRLYVYGAHVINRSKSFVLDLGHWRPCRKFCQSHEFGNDEFLGIRQIIVILWEGNMFFKWKRIEWECGLKRGDSCGGKVCV